jgi:uncharacterized protein (TIGR02391 family)
VPFSRPLTKELLKKLFLKTRYEIRPGGKLAGHGWPNGAVISYIPTVFPGLGKLTPEEQALAARGAQELEWDGYLLKDPTQQNSEFMVISDTGLKAVIEELDKMQLPSIDIDKLLSHGELRRKIRDDYVSGDYEGAVFKAFKLLEEAVRAKAKEPATSLGVNLMTAAFGNTGKLTHPGAAVAGEKEALHHMMRGAIGWFKNPISHRTVIRDDPQHVAHILAFANVLLDLLDQTT